MTSPSPDIESLIAAARERHRPVKGHWSSTEATEEGCGYDGMGWPCPDRLLLDALLPVYEAAKAVGDFLYDGIGWIEHGPSGMSTADADRLVELSDALRATLGEPNA